MLNLKNFLYVLSAILVIEGVAFGFCLIYALYYGEPHFPFLLPALFSLSLGIPLYFAFYKKVRLVTNIREGFVLLSAGWVILILVGTLPYMLDKSISSFIDVIFETTSGFTTTGTSALADVSTLPKSIIFWRSLTHWLGGLATLFTVCFTLPTLDFGGNRVISPLYKSGRGSSFQEKTFNFRSILKGIILSYGILTVAQILLLHLGGISLFDNLCYTFGTISTGSFSPNQDDLSGYSHYIQYVMLIFMILSGLSYLIYFQIFIRRAKAVKNNEEISLYALIIISASLIATCLLYFKIGKPIESSFREGAFQAVSFIVSSGYSVTDYLAWPSYSLVFLASLLFIGACTGSASGGIKVSRFLIFLKTLKQILRKLAYPSEWKLSYNNKSIDEKTNLSILTFLTVFGLVFLVGMLVLSALEIDLKDAAFFSISALSTFGLKTNLAHLTDAGKITLSFLMVTGRLEIYPILLLFIPSFYSHKESLGSMSV